MNKKILSIIIPVYNVERYLRECLQSIIDQIYLSTEVEIILVNDGSPDNSSHIIHEFKSKYPYLISVIEQSNQGLSMARNNGFDVATGDYIWFVDSDDWLPSGAIKNVLNEIYNHSDVDVFSSFLSYYYEDKDIVQTDEYKGNLYYSGLDYIRSNLPTGASVRFICKRELLKNSRIRFLPNLLHEDAFWGYMMLYNAKIIKFIIKPIYVYRIRNSGSIMSSISIRSAYDLITGHKYLCSWMKTNVANKDKAIFQLSIFRIIKALLNFIRGLVGSSEGKEFLRTNKEYIRKQALDILKISINNASAIIIFISPFLFSKICLIYNKSK